MDLSDAIIGLTIFAVGNSLADLVANMSVAVSVHYPGPFRKMIYIHCLGLCSHHGLLGMFWGADVEHPPWRRHLRDVHNVPYVGTLRATFGTTLFVCTIGLITLLVTTLIVVPLKRLFPVSAVGHISDTLLHDYHGYQRVVELKG